MVVRQQRRLKEPTDILDQPAFEPLLVQVVEDGVLDDWNASSGIEQEGLTVVDDKGSRLADELTNDAAIFWQVVVFDVDAQEVNRVHGRPTIQSKLPAASVHKENFLAKLKADDVPSLVTDSDTRVGECD